MTDFIIRLSEKSDMAAVDALLARTYPKLLKNDYPPSVLVTALPIITRARPSLIGCGTYFVAEASDGRILGAGGWTPTRRTPRTGDIRHVVTDDRVLRQGVARAIMAATLGQARQAGITHMNCFSTLTAVSFYEAMGFEVIGPMEVMLAQAVPFPAVRMQQIL